MKFLVIIILLLLAGCAAVISYKSRGEELYYDKCGGCHRLHSGSEYSIAKWQKVMEGMSTKAKLNTDEKRLIMDYLIDAKLQPEPTK